MNNDFFDDLNEREKKNISSPLNSSEESDNTTEIKNSASNESDFKGENISEGEEAKETSAESVGDDELDTSDFLTQSPIYTESVKHPTKTKRKFRERTLAVAVLTAFCTLVIVSGGFCASLPLIKNYVLSGVTVSEGQNSGKTTEDKQVNVPGAKKAANTGTELSNNEIATLVSPSIVGISNMGYASNTILNVNTVTSTGSGIIISSEGYIITNNHVVEGANKLKVTLITGEEYDAKLVGSDAQTDIAVIKIEPNGAKLTAATLGYSSNLKVGDEVFAIGNPLGMQLAGSVTYGIVSAMNRKLTIEGATYNLIQTDAAINSGNSGGALVNRFGEVIGINSIKVSSNGVEGLGFAIPIDDVKAIIEDLCSVGYVKGRPSLGIEIAEINNELAYYYSLPVNYGLFVNSIVKGGSADLAGIQQGDIIIAFNGEKITTSSDLISKRNKYQAGDSITLTVNRAGKELKKTLKLQEDKPSNVK
ncbi:MAG: trypsin-like peptidase domain-containing protein [Bacillota bacterium]|nr:trypsin-like peptidase domain-containing protein [Bacillota bacterium]